MDRETQPKSISKRKIKTILDIQELPEWFDLKNYCANQLDLEGWIIQLYIRQMIQGFLLPAVLTGIVDDYHPKPNMELSTSKEAIHPISLQDALVITETIKNIVHIPPQLWQAPSHFAFFEQSGEITNMVSILSWFYENSGKNKLPSKDSYLTQHTNSYLLRPFLKVDLTAPDSVLFASFKQWLARERKLLLRQRIQKFSKATLRRWATNQVLPYIDLTYWANLKNKQIPYWLMGKILFPGNNQGDTTDRIRKTTEKTAKEIMMDSCLKAMAVQLAEQTGKKLNLNTYLEDLQTKYKVHI